MSGVLWTYTHCFSLHPAGSADSSLFELVMKNCRSCHPESQGYQPLLSNQYTSSHHKQSSLLVHIHLRLFGPSLCLSLCPAYPDSWNWLSCLLFFKSPDKCTWEKRSLWILFTDWSLCKIGSWSESPVKWNSY